MLRKVSRVKHYAQVEAQNWLRKGLGWAYGSPEGWQQRLLRPMYFLNQYAMLNDRSSKGQVYISNGISGETGRPMKVGFVGPWISEGNNLKALYESMIYQEGTVATRVLGDCEGKQLRRAAEQIAWQVDLIAITADQLLFWEPLEGAWVSGPGSLRMSFYFHAGEPWEDVVKRMKQEYNLRILRRSGLKYRISHQESDFQRFYHEMYVPLIRKRFGEGGEIIKEADVHNVFKLPGGSVLVIETPEGEAVGGGVENIERKVLYAMLNGVLNGSQELIKKGVLTGWYYFSMQRAFENGCTRFDSGPCQPLLTDGVYIHKHRWGEQPSINYWRPWGLMFWAPGDSPEALAWMKTHPMHPAFARYRGKDLQPVYAALNGARSA